jgi:hypothetical protein
LSMATNSGVKLGAGRGAVILICFAIGLPPVACAR